MRRKPACVRIFRVGSAGPEVDAVDRRDAVPLDDSGTLGGPLRSYRVDEDAKTHARKWMLDQLPGIQGAVVILDVKTGEVRALVGGYDFAMSKFNRAIQSRLSDRGYQYPTVTPVPAAVAGGAPVANRPVVPQPGTRPAANAAPPPEPVLTPAPAANPRAATPLVSVGRAQLPVGESRMDVWLSGAAIDRAGH